METIVQGNVEITKMTGGEVEIVIISKDRPSQIIAVSSEEAKDLLVGLARAL